MPAPQREFVSFAAGNVAIVGVTETVAGTSAKVSSSYQGCAFFVLFGFQLTAGATMTSVVAKIVEGAVVGGTAIYTSGALTMVNAGIYVMTVAATDAPAGDVSGLQWALTLTQAGGAGNGTAANVWSKILVAQ